MTLNLNKTIRLAYRNLFRNFGRTAFIVFIVAGGFCSISIAIGYYSFSVYGLKEMTIRNGFGGTGGISHAQIADVRVLTTQSQQSLKFGISNSDSIKNDIVHSEGVDYVMGRLSLGGLISNGDLSFPYIGFGVQVDEEIKLRNGLKKIDPKLELGNDIVPLRKEKYGIILGNLLAKSLGAKIGDNLLLYSTTASGAVNAIDVVLTNIITTGSDETDKYYLLTHLETAQELVNTDKVSSLCVMFTEENENNLSKKVASIDRTLQNKYAEKSLNAIIWNEYGEHYKSIKGTLNIIFIFMGCIIIIIVLLSCWNIMNLSTMERFSEIGTLRAIGIKIHSIGSVFLVEAFLIGVFGVFIGFGLQQIISFLINNSNIMMPPVPGMNQPYALKIHYFTPYHAIIVISIITATTLSSLTFFVIIKKRSIIDLINHR